MAAPSAPSNLVAIAASASRIDLTWVDNSNNEVNFELERSLTGVGAWSLINSPAANAVSYANTGLSQNTTYYYRIRAVNADGNSAYSSVASALTMLPGHAPLTPRMYLLQPATVFAARVNQSVAAVYPVFSVVYDGVTTGTYTDIQPGMTLLLGSSAGADDYGRQRVREVSGAGATSIVVWVGRSSRGLNDGELTIVDNAYITVWDDRRVWAKIPFIDSSGEIFKDGNLAVSDRTTDPPPVAVMGAGFAGTIDDDDVITVTFNGQDSYAVEDAATITDYLWDIADGTLDGGALTDDNITATFPAGFRYVSLEVTDSNNKTHITYRPVFARDPEDDDSFNQFQIESHKISESGQSMMVRILADMPRATYPDGTLAMVWGYEPSGSADRNHMLMIGWLDVENASINAGRRGLTRDTSLTILDVAGRLDRLPGFPQSIADDDSRDTELIPDITWAHMVNPNLDKYLHYLLHWHSNALDVADFVWSGDGSSYPFTLQSSDGQSLWAQVDRVAKTFVPDRVFTCDRAGRLAILADPLLAETGDRTATVQAAIDESEWSQISFSYQRSPKVHWVRSNAVLALDYDDLPLDVESNKYIPSVYSIAPGDTPGQGLGEIVQGSQLTPNQTALNAVTGHRYARANARVGLITLNLIVNDSNAGAVMDWAEIEPAWKEWITLTVSAETAAYRGLTWTTARALPKELNIRYNHSRAGLTRTIMLTAELETTGEPGQTVIPPNVPVVGVQPEVETPPDFGLISGMELVAGIDLDGNVYRTTDFQTDSGSGGPTWDSVDLSIAETLFSFTVDPFSPGYVNGSGSIDGWIASEDAIYRVEDLFGTPSANAVHTFATTADAGSFHWRTIQASFGAYFAEGSNPWLVCVSYYGNTVGHSGTWSTYSVDGGVTWSTEVQISDFYDTDTATRFNPIGVYTSPKTPGLAYTAAHGASDPEGLPMWVTFDEAGALSADGPSLSTTWVCSRLDNSAGPNDTGIEHLVIAPPTNTSRIKIGGFWSCTSNQSGFSSTASSISVNSPPLTVTHTDDFTYTAPNNVGAGSTTFGLFELEATLTTPISNNWSGTIPEIGTASGDEPNDFSVRFLVNMTASGSAANPASIAFTLSVWVLEIELEDSTVYTFPPGDAIGKVSADWGATWADSALIQPGSAQAGTIHLPFEDNSDESLIYYGNFDKSGNRQFRLKKSTSGVITDISPIDTGVSFGSNRPGFTIRAYDSDRQKLLLAGIGNDTTADPDDDLHGVFVSDDAGATWSTVVSPIADSGAPTNRPAFEAAFAGDTEQVIYIWGPPDTIGYSDDFGATVDDRSGNLSGTLGFIGIAGGPT